MVPNPKPKSKKWICNNHNMDNNNYDEICTADYLATILNAPNKLKENLKNIESNTIILEISPDYILVDLLKDNIGKDITCIESLMQRNDHNLSTFFTTIGKYVL